MTPPPVCRPGGLAAPQPTWLSRTRRSALDLLFPQRCTACGEECEPVEQGPDFCPACNIGLALSRRISCPRCAAFRVDADLRRGNCGDCRTRKLLFTAVRAIGPYDGMLRDAVRSAKHAACSPLAAALGQRLAEAIIQWPFDAAPQVVVTIPMYWLERLVRRGNQASSVAQAVARRLQLPFVARALICRRKMKKQATLGRHERRKNVKDAFFVFRRRPIAGKRVLVVDDVMTTGATAQEAARQLLDAGAACVYIAIAARSTGDL